MKLSLILSLSNRHSSGATAFSGPSSEYWLKAQETHDFIVGNLLTRYNSYRVNTTSQTNTAYEWYNISSIYADAAMIQTGDTRYVSYMNNTYDWMNNMWDRSSSVGGYYATANVDGTGSGGDKYADDNSLTGIVYLDAYNVSTGATKTNYLNSARACANGCCTVVDGILPMVANFGGAPFEKANQHKQMVYHCSYFYDCIK